MVAHLGASGQLGLLDATTVKALGITGTEGWLLCCGQTRPGSIHDLTQVRQAGLLALVLGVTMLTDAGYQGLSAQTASAVLTPRPARRNNQIPVFPALAAAHEAERRAHTARRIRVEHGINQLKNWRAMGVPPEGTRACPCDLSSVWFRLE